MQKERVISLLLGAMAIFDAILVVWAFGFPDLWFQLFHQSMEASASGELLLKRCGANWAAFGLFQAIAWKFWKSQTFWLAVVAGVRFSDIFTDPAYTLFAGDPTWFAYATLPIMGLCNFALGWFFLTSFLKIQSGDLKPSTSTS